MSSKRHGIVLVSILVLTLLATFFIGALIQMNPSRLRRSVHDENRDRAAMAARAGVDYALNRLKSDWEWKADRNSAVVKSDDLVVLEDHGNVLGWIRTDDGGDWDGFRFRFNYQDGSGGEDGRDNPTYPIYSKEISFNNLEGASNPDPNAGPFVPIGDGSNYQPTDNFGMKVPGKTIALLVEGVVTPGLTPDDPNTLAQATAGTTRTVEGLYIISDILSGNDGDAVLMAGGDGSVTLGPENADHDLAGFLALEADSDNTAGIRTKGTFTLERGGADSADAKMFKPDRQASVLTNSSDTFEALTDGDPFVGGTEDMNSPFLKLQASKVFSRENEPVTLPGGVYIFKNGDKDSGRTMADVQYFDMTWDEYRRAKIEGPPPVPGTLPSAFADMVSLDSKEVTIDGATEKRDVIKVTKDVKVDGDIAIIPERGARQKAGVDGQGTVLDWDSGDSQTATASMVLKLAQQFNPPPFPEMPPPTSTSTRVVLGDGTQVQISITPSTPPSFTPPTGPQLIWAALQNGESVDIMNGGAVNSLPADSGASFLGNSTTFKTFQVDNMTDFVAWIDTSNPMPPIPGGEDSLHIPLDDDNQDKTVPQDIEVVFDPGEEGKTAFLMSDGDIFLGTHISGKGGGIAAKGNMDLIGFGIDLHARADNVEKDGIAFFAGATDQGTTGDINISTYDERRNKYWSVDISGTIYANKNLFVRLGEDPLPPEQNMDDPLWGVFRYAGAIVSLGDARYIETDSDEPLRVENLHDGMADFIAAGVSLFYDPRFLAPYIEKTEVNPTFAAISVVER